MKFNAKRYNLFSTQSNSLLHHQRLILKQTQDNPYLGNTCSDDMKLRTYIKNTSKKANFTLASSGETYDTVHCLAGRKLLGPGLPQTRVQQCCLRPLPHKQHRQNRQSPEISIPVHHRQLQVQKKGCLTNRFADLELPSTSSNARIQKILSEAATDN